MHDRSHSLEISAADCRKIGAAALEWCIEYFRSTPETPIYPQVSADALQKRVQEAVPVEPQPLDAVLAEFAALAGLGRKNGHPRMFGYVQSSGTFAGAVADFLASALNQNVTSWRSAPAATTIERQTVEWVRTMVGMPAGTGGLFLSGGSMANFAALATALRARTDVDINRDGVSALPKPPAIYASAMVHMSIPKGAAMLGIGRSAVRIVPVDAEFRMDVEALARAINDDRAAGKLPVCAVGTAGDVNTGAIDPLDAIAEVCAREQLWFHVDGAYGGFAAAAPSGSAHLAGLARADSLALDPHKWLFAPVDIGCLLVRDPLALERAFSHGATYVDVIADRDMSEFAFWDYGPELSRRFRALKLWFALKCHGVAAFADAIERNMQIARALADAIDRSHDFERLAPVPLSIVCFRYVPPGTRPGEDALNALNRRLMVEVQRGGGSYLSNATIDGAFALRACIVNFRTTTADAELLLDDIRAKAQRGL